MLLLQEIYYTALRDQILLRAGYKNKLALIIQHLTNKFEKLYFPKCLGSSPLLFIKEVIA